MKGLERITSIRLAEVLSQSGLVSNDRITEALYEQDSTGTSFVEVLVDSGQVPEWEVAKVVVQHFQLPFLSAELCEINPDALRALPEDFLFEYLLLPLDISGPVLTVAMPILSPYKVLSQAQTMSEKSIFPMVGLSSTNLRLLQTLFPDREKTKPRRSTEAKEQPSKPKEDQSAWENIFDLGDQEVLKGLNG